MDKNSQLLTGLLVDTWWFGLTQRLSEDQFIALAKLRRAQGFSAVQLVVGIPPEIGPENRFAASEYGAAWTLSREINVPYINHAKRRIACLNELGLRVIIYGGWGHQIHWVGVSFMKRWWNCLIAELDHLDVVYCLTGEITLWPDGAEELLPDGISMATSSSSKGKAPSWLQNFPVLFKFWNIYFWRIKVPFLRKMRIKQWKKVFKGVAKHSSKPFLLHVNTGDSARTIFPDEPYLAANTVQTGHSEEYRNDLWRLPMQYLSQHPHDLFINLEPCYEGINGVGAEDEQLFAYWVSMIAGCSSFCYGAQGIWNVGGDGFLSHWGDTHFDDAIKLSGAKLLGASHAYFMQQWQPQKGQLEIDENDGELIYIARQFEAKKIIFIPNVEKLNSEVVGSFWSPKLMSYVDFLPEKGSVVVVSN